MSIVTRKAAVSAASSRKDRALRTADSVFKWIGVGTVVFGVLPVVAIAARDLPGIIREIKIERMGWKGGWKQAHRPTSA